MRHDFINCVSLSLSLQYHAIIQDPRRLPRSCRNYSTCSPCPKTWYNRDNQSRRSRSRRLPHIRRLLALQKLDLLDQVSTRGSHLIVGKMSKAVLDAEDDPIGVQRSRSGRNELGERGFR